jgi:hypothetical protein
MTAVDDDNLKNDLLEGAPAIAEFLGWQHRITYHRLQKGYLDADKVGPIWITTRSRLDKQFTTPKAHKEKTAASPSKKQVA